MNKKPLAPADQTILSRVPWAWCSEPTILFYLGVLGKGPEQTNVRERLEALRASGHVSHRNRGVSLWRREKEK